MAPLNVISRGLVPTVLGSPLDKHESGDIGT
jgi:hypothetical protein